MERRLIENVGRKTDKKKPGPVPKEVRGEIRHVRTGRPELGAGCPGHAGQRARHAEPHRAAGVGIIPHAKGHDARQAGRPVRLGRRRRELRVGQIPHGLRLLHQIQRLVYRIVRPLDPRRDLVRTRRHRLPVRARVLGESRADQRHVQNRDVHMGRQRRQETRHRHGKRFKLHRLLARGPGRLLRMAELRLSGRTGLSRSILLEEKT